MASQPEFIAGSKANASRAASKDDIRWFHQIDLGEQGMTSGIDDTAGKLARLHLPEDLTGKSVLDVGAWDGFFSFECERRRARRVVSSDSYCWSGKGWSDKSGFDYARRQLDSHVEDVYCEIEDIRPETVGEHDLVLFLGVLYHLEDPIGALRKIASVTRDHLILETKVDLLECRYPAWNFYGGDELNSDPTNWWAPNVAGLHAALKSVGFGSIEIISGPKPLWQRMLRRPSTGRSWWREVQSCRVVAHAWK